MLGESVSVYLDGGASADAAPSTILDCTGANPVTLRLGALSREDVDAALAPPPVDEPVEAEPVGDEPVPGVEPSVEDETATQ